MKHLSPRQASLVFFILLAVTVLAVYFPSLHNALVFDDGRLNDGSIFGVYGSLGTWRPRLLSYDSFVWIQQLFGDGWWKQRLFNVLLHLATCGALYALHGALINRVHFEGDAAPGLQDTHRAAVRLGTVVFALNPVAVYAVAYLIQRSIVMATLFVVLALWAFVRGLTTQNSTRIAWFAGAMAAYVCSVLSKEQSVLAAALAVPTYIFVARPPWKRVLAVMAVSGVFIAAAAAVLFTVYGHFIGAVFDDTSRLYTQQIDQLRPGAAGQVFPLSIVNQAWLFFRYGVLWALPYVGWMSIDLRPAFPLTLYSFPQVLGVLGYVGLLIASAWTVLRRSDVLGLAGLYLLMPLVMFGTEFAIVWIQDPFVLYRSYLWAIALPGLIALLFVGLSPRAIHATAVVLALVLCGLVFERGQSLQNEGMVWADAAEKIDTKADPSAVGRHRPFLNRGAYYMDRDDAESAYRDFAKASALGEPFGSAQFNMGVSLQVLKKHPQALAAFTQAEAAGFKEASLYRARGESFYATGRFQEAFDSYNEALKQPQSEEVADHTHMRRAEAAIPVQRYDVAVEDYTLLLKKNPNSPRLQVGLGMALVGKRDFPAAISLFDRLIAARPIGPAYYGRAMAYSLSGNRTAANADIAQALNLEPNNRQYQQLRSQLAAKP